MGLIFLILAVVVLVTGVFWWCEKKVPSGQATCGLGLSDFSRREFDALLNKRKFSALTSWVNTPYLSQFFAGTVNGMNTCVFTISRSRYSPTTFGILLTSLDLPIPKFILKPKTFTKEVGDMLGIGDHRASFPQSLVDMYDISSEDDGTFAAMLRPEIITFFLHHEGLSVEYQNGALLVTPSLISNEQNYEPAVQRTHTLAQLLGQSR
ncbi:hypothetical protein GEOBRER4_n0376 [Citrifermentans bremense]|uniref:Uncharacterized protein n=1 Tax=Citrifermentans bremense TaxID=60035 RepID=A0A6S6LVV6_9BACT|nr:hypothetical protein [Citrifermentans bremense]BCG45619.1 hypothetical protein GEOBRER4_n0376 [Citrifermentans bremense]